MHYLFGIHNFIRCVCFQCYDNKAPHSPNIDKSNLFNKEIIEQRVMQIKLKYLYKIIE